MKIQLDMTHQNLNFYNKLLLIFCLRLATREGKIEDQGKSVKVVCTFYILLYFEFLRGAMGLSFII